MHAIGRHIVSKVMGLLGWWQSGGNVGESKEITMGFLQSPGERNRSLECSLCGHIVQTWILLKFEKIGLADKWDWEVRERRVKDVTTFFPSYWQEATSWDGKAWKRAVQLNSVHVNSEKWVGHSCSLLLLVKSQFHVFGDESETWRGCPAWQMPTLELMTHMSHLTYRRNEIDEWRRRHTGTLSIHRVSTVSIDTNCLPFIMFYSSSALSKSRSELILTLSHGRTRWIWTWDEIVKCIWQEQCWRTRNYSWGCGKLKWS